MNMTTWLNFLFMTVYIYMYLKLLPNTNVYPVAKQFLRRQKTFIQDG